MRTGILIHPSTAPSGRFLVLPHPRTLLPTYYLSSTTELFELTTLSDTRYSRSWMLTHLNQVISSGQLEIVSPIDPRFLVISWLYSVLGDGKFRSREDGFEEVAMELLRRRKDALSEAIPETKTSADGGEEGWNDILTLSARPLVTTALKQVCDTQSLPTGDQAFRLSLPKTFALLDTKHSALSAKSTYVAAPNTLGRSFERRWTGGQDPSPYLAEGEEDCEEAKALRGKIAAEIVATNLPARLAVEWFAHLGIKIDG